MKKEFKYLEITRIADGVVVKRIDVSGKSERSIERTEMGILMQMNREDFFVGEKDYDTKQKDTDEPKK